MSLDVYLELDTVVVNSQVEDKIYIREDGRVKTITREEWDERYPGREPMVASDHLNSREVFWYNITHNLGKMAKEAGVYKYLWRPEEVGITQAWELIDPLKSGLRKLKANPEHYKQFNPENGWGDYDGLVDFISSYLEACTEFPDAKIGIWR